MAERDRKRVGRVFGETVRDARADRAADHVLDLTLVGPPVAGDRKLYVGRSVFEDFESAMRRREHHHRARLAELECTLNINCDEAALEADRVGRMGVDYLDQSLVDGGEPGGTAQGAG